MAVSTTVEHQEGSHGLQDGAGRGRVGGPYSYGLFLTSSHSLGCHDQILLLQGEAQRLILYLQTDTTEVQFSGGVNKLGAPFWMRSSL